jgi:beta-hydroxylase
MHYLLAPPLVPIWVFLLAAAAVQLRGRARLGLGRQLTDYSTFTAPYNVFVYLFSKVPNRARLDVAVFPELERLRADWQTIRDEACALHARGAIGQSDDHDDMFGNSQFRRGWRRFYLKWYGDFLPSARATCPRTVALLADLPTIHGAMFTLMPPRSRLGKHRDPFASSLRYHLGLATPNSDACRIYIDGEPYAWRDGEGVLFDETFLHWVENDTDAPRIILFCDIERPLRGRLPTAVNRFVIRRLAPATASKNEPGERVGALNRAIAAAYPVHLAARRVKRRNRRLYYALKYGVIGGLLGLALRAAM